MFTANVALQNIDHKNLRGAFKALGVTLPSRKKLSGPLLDKRYAEVTCCCRCCCCCCCCCGGGCCCCPRPYYRCCRCCCCCCC
jgi:hypothetical protein